MQKKTTSLQYRTRITPTPSGFLHKGNAVNFILCWLLAKKLKGKLLLRIDDLDSERSRPTYIEDVFRSLDWLGIEWDEGPTGPDDFYAHWSQSRRMDLYEDALVQLSEDKNLLFACALSRSQIKGISLDGKYPMVGREQGIPLHAEGTAWRIKTPEGLRISFRDINGKIHDCQLYEEMRDFVVKKKNEKPSYQLASIVDDELFGTTHIVRGLDLLPSTAAQLFLAENMGAVSFFRCKFLHHPLLTDSSGEKLSKSASAFSLREIREQGRDSLHLYQHVAEMLGFVGEDVFSATDLLELTDIQNFRFE